MEALTYFLLAGNGFITLCVTVKAMRLLRRLPETVNAMPVLAYTVLMVILSLVVLLMAVPHPDRDVVGLVIGAAGMLAVVFLGLAVFERKISRWLRLGHVVACLWLTATMIHLYRVFTSTPEFGSFW